VKKNEVNLFIARGVHVEIKLGKRMDWFSLKDVSPKVHVLAPDYGFFPMRVNRFREGGLGPLRTQIEVLDTYQTNASATDEDSDGTHSPLHPLGTTTYQKKEDSTKFLG